MPSLDLWVGKREIVYGWGEVLAGLYPPAAVGLGHESSYVRASVGVGLVGLGELDSDVAPLARAAVRIPGPMRPWIGAEFRGDHRRWSSVVTLTIGPP